MVSVRYNPRPVRRLLCIFFNALTTLSLLLLVMVLVMWTRGWRKADQAAVGFWGYRPHRGLPQYQDANALVALHWRGRWTFAVARRACVTGPGFRRNLGANGRHWVHTSAPADRLDSLAPQWGVIKPTGGWAGFRYWKGSYFEAVMLPDWALIAATASMPVGWVIRFVRRRGRAACGLCPSCGYDLRATPERCPECGRESNVRASAV
jgi:hypothetical protein